MPAQQPMLQWLLRRLGYLGLSQQGNLPVRGVAIQVTRKETMNNQFDELTRSMAARLTGRKGLKKFRVVCASVALGYLVIVTSGQAQTSVLCDPPGDGYFSNGHGSAVPPWLDIVQGTVTAAGDEHI